MMEDLKCRHFSFCEKDLLFLYEILKQRTRFDPTFIVPSYEEHVEYMSNFEKNCIKWHIVSYNDIDYATFYINIKKDLALLSHLDLDILNEDKKNINLHLKKFMYDKVKLLLENLNIEELYAKSHIKNKIGINTFIRFHKKYIIKKYNIEISNSKDFVNFTLKKYD